MSQTAQVLASKGCVCVYGHHRVFDTSVFPKERSNAVLLESHNKRIIIIIIIIIIIF